MAGRYELPEGTWPLITGLFEHKNRTGGLAETISSCLMAFYGYCALEPVGVICRSASGHGSTVY